MTTHTEVTRAAVVADAAAVVTGEVATRGPFFLARTGEWFAMFAPPTFHEDGRCTPGASHRIAVEHTDAARLAAHWGGFLANHGVEVVEGPLPFAGTTLSEVKRRLAAARDKVRNSPEARAMLREEKRRSPRAALVCREWEILGIDANGRVDAACWYVSMADLTAKALAAWAREAREAGAQRLSIESAFDLVWDRFDPDAGYDPCVTHHFGVELSL